MKTLYSGDMDYVDSIMIVDKSYNIVHLSRHNPRFENDDVFEDIYSKYINKNIFEVYPSLSDRNSSFSECLSTGKVIRRRHQNFEDFKGRIYNTENVTIPIIKGGDVIGAIELSKDITSIDDLDKHSTHMNKPNPVIDKTSRQTTFQDIITSNDQMIENIRKAKIFSDSDRPSLIYGQTGTGKELFVNAMYNHSVHHKKAFIAQNCASLPESLFESILFGAKKGSYTGAETRTGLFEQADGGTLFLDELNSMPYGIQAKLLRVLQDGMIRPIGSDREKRVNVKIIAAMNMDPTEAIEKKLLREDLFYRFSSSTIRLVPLCERKEDILLYSNYFIRTFNDVYGKNIKGLSSSLTNFFMDYKWNGNVRELKHLIEAMISVQDSGLLDIVHLPAYMHSRIKARAEQCKGGVKTDLPLLPLNETLIRTEKEIISTALHHTGGNLTKAGQILQIPRQTLKYKINKLNIALNQFK